jgi:hypothetical protein
VTDRVVNQLLTFIVGVEDTMCSGTSASDRSILSNLVPPKIINSFSI